ncbi:MAG: hypothetical protein HRT81_16960 [Henriciella sp.]|nr:hypothetical protein [Henriciella sp.]
MRPPKTLFAAIASFAALAFTPAFATEGEQVEIQINLDAPATEIYESIREQAWAACKTDYGSHHVSARMTARRACQQQMIADVVNELSAPDVIELAEKDGVFITS